MSTTGKLALLVQAETEYGTSRLVARVVAVQENGELHNPSWSYGGHDIGAVYAGFEVTAYIGSSSYSSDPISRGTWGFDYHWAPFRIESAKHASDIARAYAKLEKGMDALRDAEGYVTDAEYHVFLLRIARTLKIKDFYIRSTKRGREVTGTIFRKVDGAGLQSHIADINAMMLEGKTVRDIIAS